jgi:hypothetical protein
MKPAPKISGFSRMSRFGVINAKRGTISGKDAFISPLRGRAFQCGLIMSRTPGLAGMIALRGISAMEVENADICL